MPTKKQPRHLRYGLAAIALLETPVTVKRLRGPHNDFRLVTVFCVAEAKADFGCVPEGTVGTGRTGVGLWLRCGRRAVSVSAMRNEE